MHTFAKSPHAIARRCVSRGGSPAVVLCSDLFAFPFDPECDIICLYRLDLPICSPIVRAVDCRGGSPAEFASDFFRRGFGTNGFIRGFCIRLHSISDVFSMYSCTFCHFRCIDSKYLMILATVEIQYMLFAQANARLRLPASAQCCGRRGVFFWA